MSQSSGIIDIAQKQYSTVITGACEYNLYSYRAYSSAAKRLVALRRKREEPCPGVGMMRRISACESGNVQTGVRGDPRCKCARCTSTASRTGAMLYVNADMHGYMS